MKNLLLLILVSLNVTAYSQSELDYTDTRKKNESFIKIQQKEVRTDLASFALAGIDETIGKAELTKIPYSEFGENFMTFEGDGIKATVTTAPFVIGKHKMDYDDKYLIKIDRKTYYGHYGYVPARIISKITMTIGSDSVMIPAAAYSDLYNLNFSFKDKSGTNRSTNGIYKSKDGHRIYLYLFCKDNSGSYEVTFVIQDKKYIYRVLDYGFM